MRGGCFRVCEGIGIVERRHRDIHDHVTPRSLSGRRWRRRTDIRKVGPATRGAAIRFVWQFELGFGQSGTMSVDPAGIPRRMAYWRTRRGYSRRELGRRMDPQRSEGWVEKAEGGRVTDFRIGALEHVARALAVPVERLLYDESTNAFLACVDEVETAAIRAAIARYDVTTGFFNLSPTSDPVAVELVGRQLDYGWTAFQAADFTNVARLLPTLIVDAVRTASVDRTNRAWTNASFAYQLAVAASVKFNDAPTAWQAADRAVKAAEAGGDPVTIASAARRSAEALLCLSASAGA